MTRQAAHRARLFAFATGVAASAAAAYIVATERVRPSHIEEAETLPGYDLIVAPIASLTNAITIHRPSTDVWPWLAQMGATRGGWYSYDALDNGGHPSAHRVIPELQYLAIGMVFPALPAVSDGFILLDFETHRHLLLGWRTPAGELLVTWAFVLREMENGSTRLIVRARGSQGYSFHSMPSWLSRRFIPFVHFVMERRQMLGIAARAEAL